MRSTEGAAAKGPPAAAWELVRIPQHLGVLCGFTVLAMLRLTWLHRQGQCSVCSTFFQGLMLNLEEGTWLGLAAVLISKFENIL